MSLDSFDRLKTVLAGRYAIERELGRGGMATVYLADDLRHHRKVAVKVLQPALTSAVGSERFEREIAVAAQLNHPHILALWDSGEVNGALFYVMPYVPGESLRARLQREGRVPLDDAIRITRQVASALDYAHAHLLVHRDIKPENILLHEGEAMVADFGIAHTPVTDSGQRLTVTGLTVGSPHYMSPEQAAGDDAIDARSDVYSLACVLYELLAGAPPFTGSSLQAIIAKRFTQPAPSIRTVVPGISRTIDQALSIALATDPEQRFTSCGAFAAALNESTPLPGARSRGPSIAVLPFLNMSTDAENEFFADGVTEDVIAQLSKIRSLKVISRTSVMRFKKRDQGMREIGATLDVGNVLEGSVRRAGDRVRIVAQLIDVASEEHVWADTYDRQLTDIFAIQSDVALQIASALEAELSPDERKRIKQPPTSSIQAYQLYLQGRYHHSRYTEESINKAIAYFREALEVDPTYALAHVGLAQSFAELSIGQGGTDIRPEVAYARAKENITRALALDSNLADAHSVNALLMFTHDFDWAGAEAAFKRALQLNPSGADIYDYYGWMCGALERYDEALELVTRAKELDPLAHRSDLASTLMRAGRYTEALEEAERAVVFDPVHGRSHSTLGWALLRTGDVQRGVAELERSVELNHGNTMYLAQLGQAYAISGREAQARDILDQLNVMRGERVYVSPYHLAYVYTGLGDHDRALDLLEQAHAERSGSVYGIKGSFLFTDLRGHPRFQSLLQKMKLQ